MPAPKKRTFYSEENMPVFRYSLHRHLWHFLSFHPGMTKEQAIPEMKNLNLLTDEEVKTLKESINTCVACNYASESHNILHRSEDEDFCELCPFGFSLIKDSLDNPQCLGGRYKYWKDLTNSCNILQEANDRVREGNLYLEDLEKIRDDEGNYLPVKDYVNRYIRKGYDFKTTLQDRLTKTRVQCMIAASAICCMPLKTGVKTDEDYEEESE